MLPVAYLPELFIKARGEYDGEIFFVAGLPHDIDRLVMCLKAPDQLRVVLDFAKKSGDPWHKAEANTLALIMVLSAEPSSEHGTSQKFYKRLLLIITFLHRLKTSP